MIIPKHLQNKDFRFAPAKMDAKAPMGFAWQSTNNYRYYELERVMKEKNTTNYAVVCGHGNLVGLDFDDETYQDLIISKLKPTFTTKSGGKGLFHKYFIVTDKLPNSFQVNNSEKKRLLDFQSYSKCLIGPGSIHIETKNEYEVVDNIPIAKMTYQEVVDIFGEEMVKRTSNLSSGTSGSSELCPFHDDTNPSMMTYPETESFFCFCCKAYGLLPLLDDTTNVKKKKTTNGTFHYHEIEEYTKYNKIIQEQKEEIKVEKDETFEIDDKFYKPDLLNQIHQSIDRMHKLDHYEKIALYLICLTGQLTPPNERCSAALKGDSSSGKDNCAKTCLSMFTRQTYFFLTRGTVAAIEEEASKVNIIAFSEINQREGGANAEITELYKQLAEGGSDVLKRDSATNYKTTKHLITEQKTLIYGTTQAANDDELVTRHIIIPIRSYPAKRAIVIKDTLRKAREILYSEKDNNDWHSKSIEQLDHDIIINIPYSQILEEKILDDDGEAKLLFNLDKDRIMRDHKRLLSITKAIAWLYQKQRIIKEYNGKKILFAEPTDFITAIRLFAEFFNLTYEGLDHRSKQVLDCIKKNVGKHSDEITKLIPTYSSIHAEFETKKDWVVRSEIQKELGIESVNTIKSHIKLLNEKRKIEVFWNNQIPKAYLIRPINSPVNKVSLPISYQAIKRALDDWNKENYFYKQLGKERLEEIKLDILDEEAIPDLN